MFPLQIGDSLSANLTNLYSLDAADLYLWPPDYPSRSYRYSANNARLPEALGVTACMAFTGWKSTVTNLLFISWLPIGIRA